VTTKKLKNGAVNSAKLADGAVNSTKLADGSVSASKLADGAVSAGKLADGAVTSPKIADSAVTSQELTPEERSQGFESKAMESQPVSTVDFGTLTSLSLPAGGHYLINVTASFANEAAVANSVLCRLRDDAAFVTEGVATLAPAAVYSATLSLVGASDGGIVSLNCTAEQSALAKAVVMTAVRVGSIEVQP
jgi:trimeric autotransporter adhesin